MRRGDDDCRDRREMETHDPLCLALLPEKARALNELVMLQGMERRCVGHASLEAIQHRRRTAARMTLIRRDGLASRTYTEIQKMHQASVRNVGLGEMVSRHLADPLFSWIPTRYAI